MKWLKKVAATPLTSIAKVVDSLESHTNERDNAPSIRATREAINENWLTIYPVGSIYMSVNNANPSTLFGGTWQQIKDKFLLACGDTYNNGETGGEASHNYTPTGTVGGHALTINEMPNHLHEFNDAAFTSQQYGQYKLDLYTDTGTRVDSDTILETTNSTGGGQEHNHDFTGNAVTFDNLPPYLAVNVWVRTA